jgi:hypothetical protein
VPATAAALHAAVDATILTKYCAPLAWKVVPVKVTVVEVPETASTGLIAVIPERHRFVASCHAVPVLQSVEVTGHIEPAFSPPAVQQQTRRADASAADPKASHVL